RPARADQHRLLASPLTAGREGPGCPSGSGYRSREVPLQAQRSPVVAGDLAAVDGDRARRSVMVPPDRVTAGGQPVVDGGIPHPARPGPGADSGVGAPRAPGARAALALAPAP